MWKTATCASPQPNAVGSRVPQFDRPCQRRVRQCTDQQAQHHQLNSCACPLVLMVRPYLAPHRRGVSCERFFQSGFASEIDRWELALFAHIVMFVTFQCFGCAHAACMWARQQDGRPPALGRQPRCKRRVALREITDRGLHRTTCCCVAGALRTARSAA